MVCFNNHLKLAFTKHTFLIRHALQQIELNYLGFTQKQALFGYYPSFLQMNQSSVKMLNYWGNFEPGYWEFTNTPSANGDIDSPPRRDTFAAHTLTQNK